MSPAGPYILIVDDHEDIRETLAEVLEEEGYRTATTTNGLEALAYLGSHPLPRIILLNTLMPVMGGREFRNRLRRDPRLASIPLAVITGADMELARADFSDAVAFFRKPVDLPALLSMLSDQA